MSKVQFHTCSSSVGGCFFITKNGKIFCFGPNENAQLGFKNNKTRFSPEPFQCEFSPRIRKIATGGYHTLFLNFKGEVYSFGDNGGQLSLGKTQNSKIKTPTKITQFDGKRVIDVAAGNYHSLFLLKHAVFGSGDNAYGQLGIGNASDDNIYNAVKMQTRNLCVDSVGGGGCYSLLHTKNGSLFYVGQICYEDNVCFPTLIPGIPKNEKILKFSAGIYHFLAISHSGRVYGMGNSSETQLFPRTHKYYSSGTHSTAREIPILSKNHVIDVRCGFSHSIALQSNGSVIGLGPKNCFGLPNHKNSSLYGIEIAKNISQIEIGRFSVYLIRNPSSVLVGGENSCGECGIGKATKTEKLHENEKIKNLSVIHEWDCCIFEDFQKLLLERSHDWTYHDIICMAE